VDDRPHRGRRPVSAVPTVRQGRDRPLRGNQVRARVRRRPTRNRLGHLDRRHRPLARTPMLARSSRGRIG